MQDPFNRPWPPGPPAPPGQAWPPAPQHQQPFGAPSPYGPQYAPMPVTKSSNAVPILLIVLFVGLPLLIFVGGGFVAYYTLRRGGLGGVEPTEIPKLIESKVPCKKTCKVTDISTFDGGFSVTVLAEDDAPRTLSYRVNGAGAELMFSTDWVLGKRPPTFDYREVDWSNIPRIMREMNEKADGSHKADTAHIHPCDYKAGPDGKTASACITVSVLTSNGNLDRDYDGKTGKLRDKK